jgi:cytochrome c553
MSFKTKRGRARRIYQDILRALPLFVLLTNFCLLACASKPSVSESEPASTLTPGQSQSVEPVRSETVNRIFTRTCSACHGQNGQGIAAVAPDLRRANPRGFAQWQQYLGAATAGHPGAQMPPPTWLNKDEIDVMANYLITLTQPNATPTPEPAMR